MIPYSTASAAVRKWSRSMSPSTWASGRPEWWAMISAIRRVLASTSRSWISTSRGAPRIPAVPWWIMILPLGSAMRRPAAPPPRIIAAADIPMPIRLVATGQLTCCITS